MFTIPEWLLTLSGWVRQTSVQATLIVLLILIVQWVLRDRLTPRWRYALWMIVLVRLALPWTPQSPLSIFNLIRFNSAQVNVANTGDPAETILPPNPLQPSIKEPGGKNVQLGSGLENLIFKSHPAPTPAQITQPHWLEIGLRLSPLIWLAGAAMIGIYVLVQMLFLSRFRGERVVTDQPTLELLEQCKRDMGVRTYLAIIQGPTIRTPALFGFLRPRLLLPEKAVKNCPPRELRHIFLHELAHLKRHDILVNWAMTLLQILHWFNPLVWYAFHRIRIERELACDRLALSSMTEDPKNYGQTIVHLLEHFTEPRTLPSLAGILEDKKQITRRMTMIANFKKESLRITLFAAVIMLALIAVCLTNKTSIPPAKETSADPIQILKKVQTKYNAMKSYSDTGEVITETDMSYLKTAATQPEMQKNIEASEFFKKPFKLTTAFSIKLTRPNLYLIQWEQCVHPTFSNTGAVWSDGTGDFLTYSGKKKLQKMSDRDKALMTAAGISTGVAHTIPTVFFSASSNFLNLFLMGTPTLQKSETIDGDECYVISSKFANQNFLVWISQKSLLIRQRQMMGEAPVAPPQGSVKGAGPAVENAGRMAKKSKYHITEIHRNILVNPPLTKDQFTPKPPSRKVPETSK